MDFASVELGVGVVAELTLAVLLAKKQAFTNLPAFFVYVCWGLVSDLGLMAIRPYCTSTQYFNVYLVQLFLDSAMMFAVLVELSLSLLRPIRSMLPRHAPLLISALIVLACAIVWPVSGLMVPVRLRPVGDFLFRTQQTFGILRVVFFLAMAGFSQGLSIGWRNRELQIATGLGAYSLISVFINVMHSHQRSMTQGYFWLDALGSVSYVLVLIYWVGSFAMQEADRQEFTPQMRQFLLAAVGAARSTRVALESNGGAGSRGKRKIF